MLGSGSADSARLSAILQSYKIVFPLEIAPLSRIPPNLRQLEYVLTCCKFDIFPASYVRVPAALSSLPRSPPSLSLLLLVVTAHFPLLSPLHSSSLFCTILWGLSLRIDDVCMYVCLYYLLVDTFRS